MRYEDGYCETATERLRRMQSHHVAVALAELGRQLAIAAALTRAYALGGVLVVRADLMSIVAAVPAWTPGCGRQAP